MCSKPEATAESEKNPKRLRRWIAMAVVFGLVIWFGRFAYLRIALRPTPRPEYWQAQLEALDPLPPGALTAGEVDALFANLPENVSKSWTTGVKRDGSGGSSVSMTIGFGPPQSNDLSASLTFQTDEFQRLRTKLIDALNRGFDEETSTEYFPKWVRRGGGPLGFVRGIPPPARPAPNSRRAWAAALLPHAQWSRRPPGRGLGEDFPRPGFAAVREDWLAMLHLARQDGRTRMVTSVRAMAYLEEIIAEDMIEVARTGFRDLDVPVLAAEVDAIRLQLPRPSQYFEGERLAYYARLEDYYVHDGGDWIDVSEVASWGIISSSWISTRSPRASRLWNLASPLFHSLAEARASGDQVLDMLDRLTNLREMEKAGIDCTTGMPHGWTHSILDGPNGFPWADSAKALQELYFARSRMDYALTHLAFWAYHDRNRRYPDRLEELVPQYLPRLPIDYRDLKVPIYERSGDGFVLGDRVYPGPAR